MSYKDIFLYKGTDNEKIKTVERLFEAHRLDYIEVDSNFIRRYGDKPTEPVIIYHGYVFNSIPRIRYFF